MKQVKSTYLEAIIWRELVYTVESLDTLRVVLIRDLLSSRHSSFLESLAFI